MRKKDFEEIAGEVKAARDAMLTVSPATLPSMRESQIKETNRIFLSMARSLAYTLARENAKFDKPKFLHSCGLDSQDLTVVPINPTKGKQP